MNKDKIKEFIYRNKKALSIGLGAALILTGAVVVKVRQVNSNKESAIEIYDRTVAVEKGDIYNSINVNGKIQSAEVSNVSTSLTEKVKSVNVKVGDQVKAGDIICTLDDSYILKEIEKKESEIAEEKKSLQENYNKLNSQLEALKSSKSNLSSAQNSAVETARANLDKVQNELNSYESNYKGIESTYNTMLSAINSAMNKYNDAVNYKDSCYNAWIQSGGSVNSNEYNTYKTAEENVVNKESELNSAKVLYNYDEIKSKYDAALEIYNAKVNERNIAREQYDSAVATLSNTTQSDNAEIQALTDSVNEAYKSLQKANDNEELKSLQEKLSKTVLKAETDGKVTELKVNVGSVAEGIVATIQATDKLIISVTIPEYDIKNTAVGMEAKISSDASSEKVTGKVVRISPTANSGDTSGFSADISVDNPEGMYIGSNAKVEIITSGKADILIVPIDAVKEIDGKNTVFVEESSGKFKEVEVTTGVRNDYYVEVSGSDIKEGDRVIADVSTYDINFQTPSTETEVTNDKE